MVLHKYLNEFNLRQELSEVKPLERKALAKRNRKKSLSETDLDELGKKSCFSNLVVHTPES